jgi:hypothetical protein
VLVPQGGILPFGGEKHKKPCLEPPSMRQITYPDLRRKYGITYSRRQLKRKELAGEWPRRLKHGDAPQSRVTWDDDEIVEHLETLKQRRDEKAAELETAKLRNAGGRP